MIQDSQWKFSVNQVMPNAGSAICTNYIDWTSNIWKDFINSSMPLWIVFTCRTVPSGGTSIQVIFQQYTTNAITSGDVLWSGPAIVRANLSADPLNDGNVIAVVPLITIMAAALAMGRKQYCGPVLVADGDCSSGYVDGWLHIGVNPPLAVPRPAMMGGSNIVKPA